MTNKQKIEALEKGIKSSVTPENLKEKMRTQLAQLKALEKESTSDKKPQNKTSNEDVLAVLYNADSKGWNATKAESGGDIKASDELTEKYANAVSKALKGIKKGSLSQEIFDELTGGNNHLLNEFLVWNGYYNAETTATNKASYQRIWDKGNRLVANPEVITLGVKTPKPSSATPIKKASKNYYRNKEIKSVTVLENGKKVSYAGKDVLNGANFFKEGGVLTSKATYIPVRNIVEVTFEDGSKDKPRNGYHIKNGATPIMEHGGEVWQPIVQLVPLELESLSSQLKAYTGDALSVGNYTNEEGKEYSTAPGEIIVHKESGRKFEIPEKIYDYVDGFNLVFDKRNNKIVTWEEGKLVAELKDGNLDFTNKDESISINKTKVESEFEKGFIPEKSNEKWAYIAVENKLQKLYSVAEDLEDDKTSAAWKTNQEKIKKFEDYLHRLERKYAHGGAVELPEGSLQHFENYYLEKGGKVGRLPKYVMDFQENDYKKMVQDYPNYPFYSVKSGNIQEIFSEKTEELVAKWNSKKKELTVFNPKYNSEIVIWLRNNSYLSQDQVYEIDEMFEEEEYKLGGALLSAWKRERKYVNKSEDYEVRYAKGKNRSGYKKYEDGGEVGDYAKVPVGYNMKHYGLIKKVITNDVLYPENGYEIAGIGDILHPEQFEVISSAEFNKFKKQGTEVKPNHFLIIEEEFEKGGKIPEKINEIYAVVVDGMNNKIKVPVKKVSTWINKESTHNVSQKSLESLLKDFSLSNNISIYYDKENKYYGTIDAFDSTPLYTNGQEKVKEIFINGKSFLKTNNYEKGGVLSKGDEVKHLITKKHGKVISVKELNGLEDEVVVEFEDGTTETLNSFDVEKVLEIKAKKTYDPSSGLTLEEWKAKHNIQNYGKGGATEKGQGKGAIFAIAKEIRKPGEKWQDAVARAGKLNK